MDRTLQVPDGTPAAESVSFLQRWLRSGSTSGSSVSECRVPVAVIGLHRYLSPPQTRPAPQQQCDSSHTSYDITLTDGVCRTKCLLHPSLHRLVQSSALRSGVHVNLTGWRFVHDETRVGRGGHVCITEVALCDPSSPSEEGSAVLANVTDVDSLPLVAARGDGVLETSATAVQYDTTPLQLSRKHYLPLWNDEDPEGSVWRGPPQGPPSTVVLDVSRIMLLGELESCSGFQRKLPPLLVRILQKSRLRYYGKPGHKIPYPYQAYLEVADQSGVMSVVLWNELCPEWYRRLSVGTVLYLHGYTLKQSYCKRSRPHMLHHGLKVYSSVEIGLNPWSPAASITVVPPRCVPSQWGLPQVCYQFTSRSDLDSAPSGSACDVIGMVTYVSRVERLKESSKTKDQDKFWTVRWVHAVDGTSRHPFILQIFSPSRPEVFNAICPMTYLVCTQMRVCQVTGSLPYLTSSCETEIFITGGHKGQPYVCDPRVRGFLQWTKTLKDHLTMRGCSVGGHYCYPQPPPTFTQPPGDPGPAAIPLLAAADLKTELESLQYREHRRLAVQGHIVAVAYRTRPQNPDHQNPPGHQVPEEGSLEVSAPPHGDHTTEEGSLEVSAPPHGDHTTEEPPARNGLANTRKRKLQDRTEDCSSDEDTPPRPSADLHEDTPPRPSADLHEDTPPGPSADLQLDPEAGDSGPSWVNPSWSGQRAELSDHLCRGGGLFQDSLAQSFHYDLKDCLLHRANLHPAHWTPPGHHAHPAPLWDNVECPGYYQVTILGLNRDVAIDAAFLPVGSSEDPRAVGVVRDPQRDPQGDPRPRTLLSCLTSGFLCPPSDPTTPPQPEALVSTAKDLKETPLVVVLDVCLLAPDRLEVLVSRVHAVSAGS